MKKHLFFSFLISAIITPSLYSQDIDDFKWFGDDYEDVFFMSIGYNNVRLSNRDAPNPDKHDFAGNTFKLDFKNIKFQKGEMSWHFENKLLGDMVYFLAGVIDGSESIYQEEESGISSGLLGWHSFLWNVTEPNRYQIAVGGNFSDFFLTAAYPEDLSRPYSNPSNAIVQEPNGNYYAIGPSFSARYRISNFLLAEYVADLSIPFGRIESEELAEYDGKYKNPYFYNHSLELISSKGLFIGYEHTRFFNRGNLPNNTKRRELYIGMRIKLK